MKLVQYKGPFAAGDTITVPAQQNYKYVHIGIQIPDRQPIAYIKDNIVPVDIEINGTMYRVNETGILEFDELAEIAWQITFLQNVPMETIIDIAYFVQEN